MKVKRSKQNNAQIVKMMLSERIAAAMAHAKLTPAMMVAKTGATKGAVSFWLNGKTKNLKSETALAIADATGVRYEWLVADEGDMLSSQQVSKPEINLENKPLTLDLVIQRLGEAVANSAYLNSDMLASAMSQFSKSPNDPILRGHLISLISAKTPAKSRLSSLVETGDFAPAIPTEKKSTA